MFDDLHAHAHDAFLAVLETMNARAVGDVPVVEVIEIPADLAFGLLRPDVRQAKGQHLAARIAVEGDRRRVDVEDGERLGIDDQHGQRVGFEEQPRSFFAGRQFGNFGARRGGAALGETGDRHFDDIIQQCRVSRTEDAIGNRAQHGDLEPAGAAMRELARTENRPRIARSPRRRRSDQGRREVTCIFAVMRVAPMTFDMQGAVGFFTEQNDGRGRHRGRNHSRHPDKRSAAVRLVSDIGIGLPAHPMLLEDELPDGLDRGANLLGKR